MLFAVAELLVFVLLVNEWCDRRPSKMAEITLIVCVRYLLQKRKICTLAIHTKVTSVFDFLSVNLSNLNRFQFTAVTANELEK